MDSVYDMKLTQIRNELKNIRSQQTALQMSFKKEMKKLESTLLDLSGCQNPAQRSNNANASPSSNIAKQDLGASTNGFCFDPVGYVESVYKHKNGTPRQSGICVSSSCVLSISCERFSNPHHLLNGLEEFSHVWLVFVFHKNTAGFNGTKVQPPRLNGKKVGIFSTRSPYRPNPIGLTLAKIDKIEGNAIHLVGVDLLDGTPVLDIKPYIPEYDLVPLGNQHILKHSTEDIPLCDPSPFNTTSFRSKNEGESDQMDKSDRVPVFEPPRNFDLEFSSSKMASDAVEEQSRSPDQEDKTLNRLSLTAEHQNDADSVMCIDNQTIRVADWITNPPVKKLHVLFTARATEQLQKFSSSAENPNYRLNYVKTCDELRSALISILCEDPRSVYRRKMCVDRLYYLTFDAVHVSCWFDERTVEVVKIQPSIA